MKVIARRLVVFVAVIGTACSKTPISGPSEPKPEDVKP
jgi:hypothetical protein